MTDPPLILPWDDSNRRLQSHVHPSGWANPKAAGRYNLVVIGGGTAGLVTAAGAAGLGAKVALIERHLLGGDCLNVGCVPSKALIRAARAAAAVQEAVRFGVGVGRERTVDFPAVMERMRRLRADLSPHDSAERFRELGVDVFFGEARFGGRDTIDVAGQTLRFAKAVIATGARASAPSIEGLSSITYLTNETLFTLTELPRRLAVIGAGPIGCEMAQCFARFGSEVSLIESATGILPRDDRDAAEIVRAALIKDGVKIYCDGKKLKIARNADGSPSWRIEASQGPLQGVADQILVAVGRAPNVEGLGLEAAGVAWNKTGVAVNDFLQTSNSRIYACGDVCSEYQFTHAADFMARLVIQNALFKGRRRVSRLTIPWATYTSPEVAQVGLGSIAANAQGIETDTYTQPFSKVDRAILDGEEEGFVRVHVRKGTDQLIGATVVAAHAGEMIGELSLALTSKIGLSAIGAAIHPYPTKSEAIRKLGDLYSRTRLTPLVKKLFSHWLAWQRR